MPCTRLKDFYEAKSDISECWSFEWLIGKHLPNCPDCSDYWKKRKEEAKLTCDKTKEPPCHLEPSDELCGKCELNNCEKEGNK